MYSDPTISYVNHVKRLNVVCPKHAFMPCWIAAVQYVARGLHFSASSLILSDLLVALSLLLLLLLIVGYNNLKKEVLCKSVQSFHLLFL